MAPKNLLFNSKSPTNPKLNSTRSIKGAQSRKLNFSWNVRALEQTMNIFFFVFLQEIIEVIMILDFYIKTKEVGLLYTCKIYSFSRVQRAHFPYTLYFMCFPCLSNKSFCRFFATSNVQLIFIWKRNVCRETLSCESQYVVHK